MKLVPDIYSVPDLLELVDRGRLALPQFQRDFVWRPAHVVDLLHTVAKRWPAGTFLLLEGPQDFAVRPIDSGPRLTTAELLILDGQQRMTALYQAFRDEGKEAYVVDLGALDRDAELAEEFISYRRRSTFERAYPTYQAMAEDLVATVPIVADDARFFEWINHVADHDTRSRLIDIRTTFLAGFKSYDIPVVRLPRDVEMEALAKIFETINRTGVRLATFDLMVARLYPHDFNLAEEWELATAVYADTLGLFGVDGIEILKLIALTEHLEQRRSGVRPFRVKGVRESDVLSLSAEVVKARWPASIELYVRALEWVRDECGAIRADLIPSAAMLLPMAAFLEQGSSLPQPNERLRGWYWNAIVSQSYAQGANTQAVSDARRLILDEEAPSELSGERANLDFDVLFDSRRRNEILVRGILGRLIRDGARDPVTGRLLSDIEGPLVVRHVFPRRFVASRGGEPESILNLIVASAETSSQLGDLPPADYAARVELDPVALTSQHCRQQLMADDAYGDFIADRAKEFFTLIQVAAIEAVR